MTKYYDCNNCGGGAFINTVNCPNCESFDLKIVEEDEDNPQEGEELIIYVYHDGLASIHEVIQY